MSANSSVAELHVRAPVRETTAGQVGLLAEVAQRRLGERIPGDHVVRRGGDDGRRLGHPAQQPGHVRADVAARPGGRRRVRSGQPEQVGPLGRGEAERAGDGLQDPR
jgi:hypothetical protein